MKTTPTLPAFFLAVLLAGSQFAAPLGAQKAPPPAADVNKTIQDAAKMANAGNLAGAIKKIEDVRKSGAVTPLPGLALLGALYLQANRPQEALAVLKPLADVETADPAVLYNAGRAARALGQNNVWIGYLQRAARLAPASPATRDLGFVYMGEGQVVEAYSLLRNWARQNPSDSEARITAASLAIQLERPKEAEELILNMPQGNPAILLLRGRIQVQKGDGPAASPSSSRSSPSIRRGWTWRCAARSPRPISWPAGPRK